MATASYTAQKDAFGREVQWLVEIDLDRCTLVYTQGACTAVNAGDGARCDYAWFGCQVPTAYVKGTRTLRFCLSHVAWPDDTVQVYPMLRKMVPIPQRAKVSTLQVIPEKLKMEFALDYSPPPLDHDKGSGFYNTARAGEFWRNLKSWNRNYIGRPLRLLRGFNASGFLLADFDQLGPDYLLTNIDVRDNSVVVEAESPLKILKDFRLPFGVSRDNNLLTALDDSTTTVAFGRDVQEIPDPADYSRFSVYIRIDSEVMSVTSVNTGADTAVVVRGRLGTIAEAHDEDSEIEHVAFFGVDNGANVPTGQTVATAIHDLLHWAGVADADINTTSFTDIDSNIWPGKNVLRTVEQSTSIAKHMRKLRDTRGLMLFMDASFKWTLEYHSPVVGTTVLTSDHFIDGSVSVKEDEEERITRVRLSYAPTTSEPDGEEFFSKHVTVIDATLESGNAFGAAKDSLAMDPWIDPATPVVVLRNIAARMITRLRNGIRTYTFRLELKEADLHVGDSLTMKTDKVTDRTGTPEARPAWITSRKELSENVVEYQAVDVDYGGRFLRIAPAGTADGYDSQTDEERQWGVWGNEDGRVGATSLEEGYLFL